MRILFFISIALWVGISQAQSVTHKSDTFWYNTAGASIVNKDTASLYLTIHFADRKAMEQTVRLRPSRQLLNEATFDWQTQTGYAKSWFNNGQLHSEQELYCPSNDSLKICIRYISCFDSTGRALLQQGNGLFADWHPNGRVSVLFAVKNGMIVDSVKIGSLAGKVAPYNPLLTRVFSEDTRILNCIVDAEPTTVNLMEVKQRIGYPALARDAGLQGLVIVRVLVDAQGNVSEYALVKSAHGILDNAVLNQIQYLRFNPCTFHGHQISCWMNVPFKFTLLDGPSYRKQKKKKK